MKDEILQTALKQFLKSGIREMSIQKLVEPMGISTKTVYKYFKNKEQLLEEALHFYHLQQFQLLEELSAQQKTVPLVLNIWYTAFERDYKVTNSFFRDLKYYYPEVERKIQRVISVKFIQQFKQILQNGIEEGVFREDTNPDIVMESIFILYDAATKTERFKPFRISPFDILQHTIFVYIKGFCTPKGIEELEAHVPTLLPFGKASKGREKVANAL
jgi:AcrR family transcriptional regulator